MGLIFGILYLLVELYLFVLFARAILDVLLMMAVDFQPRGVMLLLVNIVYALTDPPLRFLSRYIPPIRLGRAAIDSGFMVLFFALIVTQRVLVALM